LITENNSVNLGAARSAQIRIVMDTGELTIVSGSENLLDGAFEYTAANLRPEISYEVKARSEPCWSTSRMRMIAHSNGWIVTIGICV
jgi:hypothetical protein